MLRWLIRLFDKKCDFYNTCKCKSSDSNTCNNGPTWFDGVEEKSYCGQYRKLAGWIDTDNKA